MTYVIASAGVFEAPDDETVASAAKSALIEFQRVLEGSGITPVGGTVATIEAHRITGERVLLDKIIHKTAT